MPPPEPVQSKIVIPGSATLALLGSRDENLKVTEDLLAADVHVRGKQTEQAKTHQEQMKMFHETTGASSLSHRAGRRRRR